MIEVVKSDGSSIPFDRAKLARSMRAAGASESTSEEVADAIERAGDMMPIQQMGRLVMHGLDARDHGSAERHDATRWLVARTAIEVTRGVARLPPGILMSRRLDQGEDFQLMNAGRVRTVHAELNERTITGKNEVRLHSDDMRSLDLEDGDRIVVVRQSQGRASGEWRTGGPSITHRAAGAKARALEARWEQEREGDK